MKESSPFVHALPLKRRKKFAVGVLDFLLLGVVTLFGFAIAETIGNNLPPYQESSQKANAENEAILQTIVASKVGEKDSSGDLMSLDAISERFVYRATLASLQSHGIDNLSNAIYATVAPSSEINDNAFFYLTNYRPSHASSFDGTTDLDYSMFFSSKCPGYFDDSSYPLLVLEKAQAINDYFLDENYVPGKEAKALLKEGYKELMGSVVEDFQDRCLPYKEAVGRYEKIRDEIYGYKWIELLLSYGVASLLYFFVLPLLLKHGRTISMRINGASYVWKNDTPPSPIVLFGKGVLQMVFSSFAMMVPPLIFYGSQGVDLLLRPLSGGISLLSIGGFSLLCLLLNGLFCFAFAKKKQTLLEALFHLEEKDALEMVGRKKQ